MTKVTTFLFLMGLLYHVQARDLHATVESAFSERFFFVLEMVCYGEDVEVAEEVRAHHRDALLVNSFFYWLSVRNRIIPENERISKIVARTVDRADDKSWKSLIDSMNRAGEDSPAHSRHAGMQWYDYKTWKADLKVFRSGASESE